MRGRDRAGAAGRECRTSLDNAAKHHPQPPPPAHTHIKNRSVGRTARAGRSGRSVTVVTQYDVETFQKIEHLTGVKMEAFPAEREEVLLLLERVGGAQRIATMQMREADAGRRGGKKRGGGGDGDEDEGRRGFMAGGGGGGKKRR